MTRTFEYKLFADYHQFYVQDEGVEGNLGDSWTPDAVARDLAGEGRYPRMSTMSIGIHVNNMIDETGAFDSPRSGTPP